MRKESYLICFIILLSHLPGFGDAPWTHGDLKVSNNQRFLIHEDGTPFFWLGNTAWLMPERLTRDEVSFFLSEEASQGFNVEQVQVLNAIPTYNIYGQKGNNVAFDFTSYEQGDSCGYWQHLDFIVDEAARHGIYIAMVCIWGSQIKHMDPEAARRYGTFLARRYQNRPNIIWVIGGDVMGDKGMASWDALAESIKRIDKRHLMTFHPRGRTTSARWFNDREWLDFNMFQSGHRRYGQRKGNANYPIPDNTEEDNWQYVDSTWKQKPMKPVIDGEPSYEEIPQGLHDPLEVRWKDYDMRRYAYWAVFAGCFGHTYGHNSIMQFYRPGVTPAYGATTSWWEALHAPGRQQMKHLKELMLRFPFTERVPDQRILCGQNGIRYERNIATRGKDYLLVYNYSGKPMDIDLRKISGKRKRVWEMNPADGSYSYLGEYSSQQTHFMCSTQAANTDRVLIAVDAASDYLPVPLVEVPNGKVSVDHLLTERLRNPMSIDTATPRFGWQLQSKEQNVAQTRYHLIVASTPEGAQQLRGDLWDVTQDTDQSQWVCYQGKPLHSNMRCYWRVQVTTSCGTTEWSDVAMFNVGLLTESDWRGRWIGMDYAMPWDREDEHGRLSARYLRKTFKLEDKVIRNATLYICGLGLYEAFLNGQRMGDGVLTPAPTDYRKTIFYHAYDVTEILTPQQKGKNRSSLRPSLSSHCISVVLGNGRYYTMQQHYKWHKITQFGYPKLRLNLCVEYVDGTKQRIVSDETWRLTADGAIRSNNEYDGEIYDATKELTGWTMPDYDDSHWLQAERVSIPTGTLRGMMMPVMKVVKTLTPKEIRKHHDTYIVDFGQNFAGWVRVRMNNTHQGDTIMIRYAERVDSTGALWRENFRHAESTDRYIANGKERQQWWRPVFSYHGGRYVEICGWRGTLSAKDVIGEVISDEMAENGVFDTNDTILQKVIHNARWGILSNYKGMPIDCPQRDERQPWLGDRTRGCYGEAFLFDNQSLYAKWTRDICEAQREDGAIPDVAPAFWNYYTDDVTWPAALPMALDMLLRHYGDEAPLRRSYPYVRRWMLHLKHQYQRDYLIPKDKYADWCVPPESEMLIHSEDPARKTDGTLIATAYYYRICGMMAHFAHLLGQESDSIFFTSEAQQVKEAFNRHFLTVKRGTASVKGHLLYPDSTFYGNNTVTANLLPYVFGMTPDDYVREQVEKNIIHHLITLNGGHVSCGVIGIGWLMHALTDMGRTDIAWLLATNNTYPSWGYMAQKGATTTWELWNGDTANPAMNSGNHVMLLGDLISWLYEDLVGIRSNDGFRHITLKPDFSVDEIDQIGGSYRSIYGEIVSKWKKENGVLFWHVEIPVNTQATLHLPDGSVRHLGSGSYDLQEPLPMRHPAIVKDEFLYRHAAFPQCHAASIAETRTGDLVCTYFGGTHERHPDVGIYVSRKEKGSGQWNAPQLVAKEPNVPHWNPVIWQAPDGELRIYYKVGPTVSAWKGFVIRSHDGGKTWTQREQLPDSLYGPIKNKPILNKRRLIAPTSDERDGWKTYFEYSDDMGKTWKRTDFVQTEEGMRVIQPTIIVLPDGRLEALCRTRSRYIGVTFSEDNGTTWTPLELIDTPNNNSGIDAVTLQDGTFVMACNEWEIEPDKTKGVRTPLSLLRSTDGIHWNHWITLEDSPISQYSYPSIIQSSDGHLHVVYTWRRQRVKHVEIK